MELENALFGPLGHNHSADLRFDDWEQSMKIAHRSVRAAMPATTLAVSGCGVTYISPTVQSLTEAVRIIPITAGTRTKTVLTPQMQWQRREG